MTENDLKFFCDRCGLCCQSLAGIELYADLDDGTGVCRFFDPIAKLCRIYETRPLKCNVRESYSCFQKIMSLSEYYQLNYEACRKLKDDYEKKKSNIQEGDMNYGNR